MRVLVLGGAGMLGHKLWQVFHRRFDTYVTLRKGWEAYRQLQLFDPARTIPQVSAEYFASVIHAVAQVRPDVVVNCIGIVKQQQAAKDPLPGITVNALFPHQLARLCQAADSRLIHLSTDCVFSGRKGRYEHTDAPDAEDLYGRTKLLGEVSEPGCLTLRTSIIGRELGTAQGLLEWFLSQRGKTVSGYRRALFSGWTTNALARVLAQVITDHAALQGVWHVAAEAINKHDLLALIKTRYQVPIQIEANDTVVCDRSLNGERFRQATGITAPSWPQMIEQMHTEDAALYGKAALAA
jgi:dTDP-4-dehydrorhamnose reductase